MNRLEFTKLQRKNHPSYLMPRIEVECQYIDFVTIGENVSIRQGCTIGTQGFGYEYADKEWLQIPHVGGVVIGDNVIIHEQTNVCRGTVGDTVIGEGTRIDSLVHVGHNVKIGKNCIITAGVVLGGSCEIGDNTWIGPNSWVEQKTKVGNNCLIGAGAVVITNVPPGEVWAGNPAKYLRDNHEL